MKNRLCVDTVGKASYHMCYYSWWRIDYVLTLLIKTSYHHVGALDEESTMCWLCWQRIIPLLVQLIKIRLCVDTVDRALYHMLVHLMKSGLYYVESVDKALYHLMRWRIDYLLTLLTKHYTTCWCTRSGANYMLRLLIEHTARWGTWWRLVYLLTLLTVLWAYCPWHAGVNGSDQADWYCGGQSNHHKWLASRKIWRPSV